MQALQRAAEVVPRALLTQYVHEHPCHLKVLQLAEGLLWVGTPQVEEQLSAAKRQV